MPICPKDVLQGRGRHQDVYPWQRVTTKIKYHPFSLAAGAWVCTSLSSSKQTTWPGKSGVLPSGLWGGLLNYRDLCVLSVPKLVSRPELAELCRSLGQLQQEGPPPHTHFVLNCSGLGALQAKARSYFSLSPCPECNAWAEAWNWSLRLSGPVWPRATTLREDPSPAPTALPNSIETETGRKALWRVKGARDQGWPWKPLTGLWTKSQC